MDSIAGRHRLKYLKFSNDDPQFDDSSPVIIESLQAGRAIASLAVVFHHAALSAAAFSGPFIGYAVFELGYLGVDFFFVLSGFIIFHATVGTGKSVAQYAQSRFRRVYLPYLPVGIGMALLYSFLPQLSAADGRSWTWLSTLTLAPCTSAAALSVAWTLKHEILFYAIFGLGYYSGRLTIVLGLWLAAIIAAVMMRLPNSVPFAPINLEFFMGIATAVLARRGWGPNWLLIPSAGVFALWLALGADRSMSPIVGIAFGVAMLPVIRMERRKAISVPAWLTFLGTASYAIYLVHNPAISAAARLSPSNPYAVFGIGTLLGTVAGISYYWLIERHVIGKSSRHSSTPKVTAGMGA